MRGLNSDNDSAFHHRYVWTSAGPTRWCLAVTAYRKNDQAWVEQKNGSVFVGSWATGGCRAGLPPTRWLGSMRLPGCT